MTGSASRFILLVDDDDKQRKLLRDVLTHHGHTVYAVSGAEEALSFLYSSVPSVILLDIMMPVMNGIELCRQIRKRIGDKMPIIFITAVNQLGTIRAALEAGGDDFIVKGAPLSEVMAKLDPWLKAPSLRKDPNQRRKVLDAIAGLAG